MIGQSRNKRQNRKGIAWRALAAAGVIGGSLFTVAVVTSKSASAATFGNGFMDLGGTIQYDGTGAVGWANSGTGTTHTCSNGGVSVPGTNGLYDCGGTLTNSADAAALPTYNSSLGSTNGIFQQSFNPNLQGIQLAGCPNGTKGGYSTGGKFSDNIAGLGYTPGGAPDAKDQIGNAYAVARVNPTTGDDEIYVGVERFVNNGDSHIAFEFLQENLETFGSGASQTSACGGTVVGGTHESGDVALELDFTNGGGVATPTVLIWSCNLPTLPTSNGVSCSSSSTAGWFDDTTAAVTAGAAFATSNTNAGQTDVIPCGGWVCENGTTVPNNEFAEGAIDLDALGINASCASDMVILSKSSQSTTADLHGIAPPVAFNDCTPTSTTTTPMNGTSAIGSGGLQLGDSATDSAAVSATQGTKPPAGNVQFYTCSGVTTGCDPTSTGAKTLGSPVYTGSSTGATTTYTSPSFKPTAPGNYCFAGVFTGTDSTGKTTKFEPSSDTSAGECFTVNALTPTFTTSPNSTGYTFSGGTSNFDTATVQGSDAGGVPTGTVTFGYCQESTVGTPCDSGGTAIGTATSGPGTTADSLVATSVSKNPDPGTYCFYASFSSTNANYNSVTLETNGSAECFTVSKQGTATTTNVVNAAVTFGGSGSLNTVQDTVKVAPSSKTTPAPTGTVQFYVCQPTTGTQCTDAAGNADGAAQQLTVPTSGYTSTATSPAYTPSGPGTYCFAAVYSGDTEYSGSSDNLAPNDPTDTSECVTVGQAPSSVVTAPQDPALTTTSKDWTGTEVTGASAYDSATVNGSGTAGTPTGTITFTLFSSSSQLVDTSTCTAQKTATVYSSTSPANPDTEALTSGTANSKTFGPLPAGNYGFQATYNGDGNGDYSGSTGLCEPFSVGKAQTQTTSAVVNNGTTKDWADGVAADAAPASVHDTAAVGGEQDGIVPTGSVTYTLYHGTDCKGDVVGKADTEQLKSDGSVPPSADFSGLAAGGYGFVAVYTSGDANYADSTGACEPFTVLTPATVSATKSDTVVGVSGNGNGVTVNPFNPNLNTITYTINLSNSGQVDATGVTVTDQVPTGATFVSASGGATPDNTGLITWSGLTVPVGTNTTSVTFTVTANKSDSNGDVITNQASFSVPSGDLTGCGSSTCQTNTVSNPVAYPVISASKVGSPNDPQTVNPFDPNNRTVTYTITVSNAGNLPATVPVSDAVPAGTTFASFGSTAPSNTGSFDSTSNTVSWSGISVPAQVDGTAGTASVTFSVTANTTDTNGQHLDNFAVYTIPGGATSPSGGCTSPATVGNSHTCDTNTVQVTVAFPVVTGTKSSTPPDGSTVHPGDSVKYTITLTNSGPVAASGVSTADAVPAGTTFVSADNGGTQANGKVTWTGLTVPANGSLAIDFTVTVNASDGNGTVIPNEARFTDTNAPTCTGDGCPTNEVKVTVAFPIVTGVKSSNPPDGSIVKPGDSITYTVTLTNSGGETATGETVADSVPAGTTFVSATDGGTLANGSVSWSGLTVAAGGSTAVSFTVTVNSDDTNGEVLPNTAQFTCPGAGTCRTNTVNATVEFPIVTGVKSSNPADGSVVQRGDSITYTVTLSNSGGQDATAETTTDAVPAGTTFVSATDGGTLANGSVTWTGLTVPAGGSTAVSFTVTVNSNDTNNQVIPNTAQFTDVNTPNCAGASTCSTNTVTVTVHVQAVAVTPPATTTTTAAPKTTTTTVPPKQGLAFTGADILRTLAIGLLMTTGGATLVLISRRRRQVG